MSTAKTSRCLFRSVCQFFMTLSAHDSNFATKCSSPSYQHQIRSRHSWAPSSHDCPLCDHSTSAASSSNPTPHEWDGWKRNLSTLTRPFTNFRSLLIHFRMRTTKCQQWECRYLCFDPDIWVLTQGTHSINMYSTTQTLLWWTLLDSRICGPSLLFIHQCFYRQVCCCCFSGSY